MSDNRNGTLVQRDFADNVGGTNLVDSVFKIQENQAAGGFNFDYVLTGGVRKRLGSAKVNSVADSALRSLGFGLLAPVSGLSKSLIRCADTKLELLDTSTPSFTTLTQDTAAAGSAPFTAASTQQVQMAQFSSGTNNILWGAGGGAALPVGVYSTSKFTANGSSAPSGAFSGVVSATGGSWTATGSYYYALVWRKASTQALSNAALDFTSTIANTTDKNTLTITPPSDVTLYDQVWVYRSARSGVSAFTTGSLIAQLPSSTTTFVDKGDLGNPDILGAQNIPRSANTVLDNSTLPSGTYNTLALWGHRLCTSSGNSLYISDVNKSESWPLTNYITVPSAGPITALATISFTSPQANSLQELLVIFKERELWVLSPGSLGDYTTWTLLKIDNNVGCPQQSLVVTAQGFLTWIDYRGVWLWDGSSKPIYCSRLLEPLFGTNGDLDKSLLSLGCGSFFRRENQVIWFLSSKTYGEQKFTIKMDVRLTLGQVQQNLTGRTIDGIFIQDVRAFPVYASLSYVPLNGQDEQLVVGDKSGFCYLVSNAYSDGGSSYSFKYLTAPLHCGNPNVYKQFQSVIAWVQDVGNWNLYLDYWSNYKTSPGEMSTIGLPVSSEAQSTALWDIATFDTSYWDAYYPNVIPIVFNLQAGTSNSSQGTSIQLQFRNDNVNEPITIQGFSVIYTELGGLQG